MNTIFEKDQYVQLKSIDDIDPLWVGGIPHSWLIKACKKPIKITGIGVSFNDTMLLLQSDDSLLSYFVNAKAVKTIIGKERMSDDMESTPMDINWKEIREIIDDAMEKRDRTVSVFINPVTGMSITFHPWPDAEDLYQMYQDGKITFNDFREKVGLPMMTEEDFFRKKTKYIQTFVKRRYL